MTDAFNSLSGNKGVIKLSQDTVSDGISVQSGSEVVLDLNNKSLVLDGEMAGSPGTKTNGFQFLKDSNITIKNGTIESDDAKILIQNYSNLTLDNVKVIGGAKATYTVSNNYGNVIFKNGTEIHASEGHVAFDAYYGMSSVYDDGVTVTIADSSVVIDGPIEYGKASRASTENFLANAHIYKPTDYVLSAPEGFVWEAVEDSSNVVELRPIS